MEKIELQPGHFSLPVKANLVIQHCKVAAEEICSHSDDYGGIPEFVPADGLTAWQLLNSVVRQSLPGRELNFCEWGSGTGLVTLLASLTGMSATGIEIDEDLIDLSRDVSRQFSVPASFVHGSIYPKDNQNPLLDYNDVDLFFAYPWPSQIVKMIDLFKQVAAPGAIFVCYHGGRNYRVLQR